MNRADLLALTPGHYLTHGYRDEAGLARRQLSGEWAVAAVEQLRAQGVSATRLAPVVAQATHAGTAAAVGSGPLSSSEVGLGALDSARGELWPVQRDAETAFVRVCREQVKSAADVPVFAQHLAAVLRLLALEEATHAFNHAAQRPR